MKKKILAIGAYERDNFGDLLFYQLLRDVLRKHEIVAGSIIYSDMRQTLGEKVLPYTYLLESYDWDAVWVVGGEVGGVDIDMAYRMSLEQGHVDTYERLSDDKKRLVQRTLSSGAVPELAYLPEMKKFPRNKETSVIINSVGVANISRMPRLAQRRRSNEILRSATSLAVRDEESMRYCEKYNIQASLHPDTIHAIAMLPNWKKLKRTRAGRRYVTFQISHALLSSFGRNAVVETLTNLIKSLNLNVVLVAAGTAVHHDSYAEYQWVQSLVGREVGDDKIEILYSRDPKEIVATIVNSILWVGTSLHGRIVASAFHVPRISLENQKVHRYASTWDVEYPSNVAIDQVSSLAHGVIKMRNLEHINKHDSYLSEQSYGHLLRIKELLA